jgi:NhaP-type Na+/H+ or K+/H+ antiporter
VLSLVLVLAIPLVWGLVAGRLARLSVTAPIAMVLAGFVLTAGSDPVYVIILDTSFVEHFVEIVLAVVLFLDATEVHGGVFGVEPKLTARLLFIALPLSLVFAVLIGAVTFPDESFWILAVIATVVMPTDLAPAAALIRDRRVPHRLREVLNVESGLNDGFVAPLFLFALAAAHAQTEDGPDTGALLDALPAVLVAVVVGGIIGFGGGWLFTRAYAHRWTEPSALRIAVAALPLVAYGLAVTAHGNGFVAAFVAGVLFRRAADQLPENALSFAEDIGVLLSLFVWFLFGQLINQTLGSGIDWQVVIFAVLVVVVARTLPVMLSLARTGIGRTDRLFLGWLGPRGLASIAFGLIAYIDLSPPERDRVAKVMVVTVLVSVVVHGLSVVPIGAAYHRRAPVADHEATDKAHTPQVDTAPEDPSEGSG